MFYDAPLSVLKPSAPARFEDRASVRVAAFASAALTSIASVCSMPAPGVVTLSVVGIALAFSVTSYVVFSIWETIAEEGRAEALDLSS